MDAKTEEQVGKCPFRRHPRTHEPGLAAEPAEHSGSPPGTPPVQSNGRGVRLCPRSFESLDLNADDQGPACLDDRLAGFGWPADFWHYRAVVSPAWRGTREGTYRIATAARRRAGQQRLRPQTAGRQREPRQGAPLLWADQEKYGGKTLLGRPDDLAGNVAPRIDGLQDVRFRRRRPMSGSQKSSTGAPMGTWLGRTLQRERELQNSASARADGA